MNLIEILINIVKEVRLSGFLDIAFISVFIYVILILFKQSKARFIVTGIVLLGLIYLLAQQLNLTLTTSLLQAFFAVIIIALIIIFQDEIRRFFEQIALWSLNSKLRTRTQISPNDNEIDILVETLSEFALNKIGALVVLEGKTSISDYLEGGELLDGIPSEALLKSIFDPNSTGHDGAVILEKGKINLFGAHLPLSKNFSQLKNRGTRHAAALGLSEVTDSLCLVVSEERGVISIARGGVLKQIDSQELKLILKEYYNQLFPLVKKMPTIHFRSNSKEKIISIFAAILLWFVFVHESRLVYRSFEVPVKISNPVSSLNIDKVEPDKVKVTFLGPRRDFYFFKANQVDLLLKIANPAPGMKQIDITESHLKFSENLSLENIEPSSVSVQINQNRNEQNENSNK